MNRNELVLALLAASGGAAYSPVQIQKAAFLVSRQAPWLVTGKPFQFVPYDYGPFDSSVYQEVNVLARQGYATVTQSPLGQWNDYAVTPTGLNKAEELLARQSKKVREYLVSVSKWVRSQSFSELVKSIYTAYPDTKVNSIFKG